MNTSVATSSAANNNRGQQFVDFILTRAKNDKGFAARLRRADNPATEYQCWEALAAFGVNFEYEAERLPFTLIAASMMRDRNPDNGTLSWPQALAQIYDYEVDNGPAPARMRRILACQEVTELCRILRPTLTLIQSRGLSINYAMLLQELTFFNRHVQRTHARWAQAFYKAKYAAKQEASA